MTEYSDKIAFHSAEGIEVSADITLLYHLVPDSTISVYPKFDGNYENELIINNIVTALRQGSNPSFRVKTGGFFKCVKVELI